MRNDNQSFTRRRNSSFNTGRVFHDGNRSVSGGFPPADDLVIVAGVLAIIGNVARNARAGTVGDPVAWVKLVFSTVVLAIILGLLDRGSFRGPVRAFAALGVLVALLYYSQDIFPATATKAHATKKGKKNG